MVLNYNGSKMEKREIWRCEIIHNSSCSVAKEIRLVVAGAATGLTSHLPSALNESEILTRVARDTWGGEVSPLFGRAKESPEHEHHAERNGGAQKVETEVHQAAIRNAARVREKQKWSLMAKAKSQVTR